METKENEMKIDNKLKLNVNSNSKFALTTFDNPYSPFDSFKEWYSFDLNKSRIEQTRDCYGLLAYFAKVSDEMTTEQYNNEMERAIDEIVKNDMTNTYVKAINSHYVEEEY